MVDVIEISYLLCKCVVMANYSIANISVKIQLGAILNILNFEVLKFPVFQ